MLEQDTLLYKKMMELTAETCLEDFIFQNMKSNLKPLPLFTQI